jgi:phosphonate transport system substrate-binding protein
VPRLGVTSLSYWLLSIAASPPAAIEPAMFFNRYNILRTITVGIAAAVLLGSASSRAQPADSTVMFRFGVISERLDDPAFVLAQYSKLLDALSDRLKAAGIRMAPLVIARDLPDMANKLTAQQVDGFLDSVFPTLDLERRTGLMQPALVAWRKGQREYRSVIFSASQGPVATLADLRGRTLVFESPRSTSAHALPKAFLRQQGFTLFPADHAAIPADAIRYVFAGAELNQAYWVLHGKGDAAAFNDGDWERLPPPLRAQLRIIAQTPTLLRMLFSFRRGVSEATQTAIETALVGMHDDPAGSEALLAASNISKFERLTAADNDQLAAWRTLLIAGDGD